MGNLDIPLSELGERQARTAIESLRGVHIQRVICSPLLRAKRTAELIAENYRLPLQVNECFKEANWGAIQGHALPENYNAIFLDWRNGIDPEGAESIESVKKRLIPGMQEALAEDTVPLIVAHGGIHWALMQVLGLSYEDAPVGNCEVVRFSPTEQGGWAACPLK